MAQTVDLRIDVTNAVDLGEPVYVCVSVVLPDPADLPERPVVCFAKPGGGYSRFYFTHALPGAGGGVELGAQADFHVARGWIFVALDNLGSGQSSIHDPETLGFAHVTSASLAAEQEVLLRLANGILLPGYPPVLQPVRLGIGQSTGGSLTIVQQAQFDCYDGIGVLGFSAVHSHPATPPGGLPVVTPWFSREQAPGMRGAILNAAAVAAATGGTSPDAAWVAIAWGFHYDDVPSEVVEQDLAHYEDIGQSIIGARLPGENDAAPWNSYTTPNDATRFTLTPGAVAAEAAAIAVPVLSAMGERDLVVDPLGESRAFRTAPSFDLFICPRMGHMHNFAGTRRLFWERIHRFGEWCAAAKAQGGW